MRFKTKTLCDRLTQVISQWPGVECIALNEAALPDTLDPYFALILDIYFDGGIPQGDERARLYGDDIAAFESAGNNSAKKGESDGECKDRFLVGNLPVRLEYKSVKMINELTEIASSRIDSLYLIKNSGTYGFYRLMNGEILFSRNAWINSIRKKLKSLSPEFWRQMIIAQESKMEHFLSDLGAACFQGDDFFYLISAGGFIKHACLSLFCINKRFEPSHRGYYKQTMKLNVLPDSFKGLFDNFLKSDPGITMERRFSLAQLIAKGIFALGTGDL
ncbi:MAG: DUF4037 domain-containing protein [Treponema sp.]|jgi:hypothetical protein|nr:DUF4037 domain-containing protein [Treponema sp.]